MGYTPHINFVNSNTTMDYIFDLYFVDASSGSITLTLPNIFANGLNFSVRRIDTVSTNTVTIVGTNNQTIDNLASILINPNANMLFNSFNGGWYTVSGNAKGNEINIAFNQASGLTTLPYVLVNNPTYTALGYFVYKGSSYYGTNPIKLSISYSVDSDTPASTNFNIQLQDLTNTEIISTLGPISETNMSSVFLTNSTITFSNVPGGEAVIEIDGKLNSGTRIRLYSITLVVN